MLKLTLDSLRSCSVSILSKSTASKVVLINLNISEYTNSAVLKSTPCFSHTSLITLVITLSILYVEIKYQLKVVGAILVIRY
jgi:hypothetical protein